VRRHASADELADYAEGVLRPRKAARITAHLHSCVVCRQVSADLESVSGMLADVSFAQMPESLSVRIDAAIATETAQRVASAPETEAGRRDLPERAPAARRTRWRMPPISPLALRVASTAAVAIVLVGGAFELASHGGSTAGPSGRAAVPAPARAGPAAAPVFGPEVRVGSTGHMQDVRTVDASTNFVPAHLTSQVQSAVRQARSDGALYAGTPAPDRGVLGTRKSAPSPTAPTAGSGSSAGVLYGNGPTLNIPGHEAAEAQLAGCVDRVAGGRIPELVEMARFEGRKATLILIPAAGSQPATAWLVGTSCSISVSDVLYHAVLSHL
jgi:hypothetical protein